MDLADLQMLNGKIERMLAHHNALRRGLAMDEIAPRAVYDHLTAIAPKVLPYMDSVWTLLDGECTPESRDKLKHHLDECPACLRHYGVEERVKNLIASKCGGEKAPERLVQRLRIEISRTTIIRRG